MIPERKEPLSGARGGSGSVGGAAPNLWVRFFGGFEVFCREEPLKLSRNSKALAILKCLLTRKGRPISQEMLMGWLWPESSPKKARWSLNSAVYALRRSLDEYPPDIVPADCVVLERGHYRLARELRISSDVEEFDASYERGRFLERAKKVEDAISEYEKAVALYQGDYLVEDLYEDWTMIERERLINAYVDVLERLADYYTKSGQLQKAISSSYRLLEKDRYHEESYRSLMRCYARLGFRGRALHQYELCKRALGGSLYGTSPTPETRALYEELLGGNDARV